jgi:hypothetical protein
MMMFFLFLFLFSVRINHRTTLTLLPEYRKSNDVEQQRQQHFRSTMSDTTSTDTSTLLEELRNPRSKWHLQFGWERKVQEIVRHQSEFPVKLRRWIQELGNKPKSCSEQSRSELRLAVKKLLFGHLFDETDNDAASSSAAPRWGGLNSEVDSEEEAEAAIRLFPSLLSERSSPVRGNLYNLPIFWAMTCMNAIPFVPLLAELGVELGGFRKLQRGGLQLGPLMELVTNFSLLVRNQSYHTDKHYGQIDETCLSVLVRLKEKGLLRKQDIEMLLIWPDVLYGKPCRTEHRVRFLINWDPKILKKDGKCNTLLYRYLGRWDTDKDCTLERFQTIFELGMLHYPEEIGFIFHSDDYGCSPFAMACEIFGREQVAQIVDELIFQNPLGRIKTIKRLMVSVATNDDIHVEGLYTLFRHYPVALLT